MLRRGRVGRGVLLESAKERYGKNQERGRSFVPHGVGMPFLSTQQSKGFAVFRSWHPPCEFRLESDHGLGLGFVLCAASEVFSLGLQEPLPVHLLLPPLFCGPCRVVEH